MKLCSRKEKMFHRKIKSFKLVLLLENRNRQIYSDVYAIMKNINYKVWPCKSITKWCYVKNNERVNKVLLNSNNMHLRKIGSETFLCPNCLDSLHQLPWTVYFTEFFTQDNLHFALPSCSSHSNKFSSFNFANFFIFIASFSIFWRPMSIRMPS